MSTKKLSINPPLLNSANPWATTLDDLRRLYKSPYTGAITTRTCTISGFEHDSRLNQFVFFDDGFRGVSRPNSDFFKELDSGDRGDRLDHGNEIGSVAKSGVDFKGSLNTLGYSPFTLDETLENVRILVEETYGSFGARDHSSDSLEVGKPILVSVTGSVEDIRTSLSKIKDLQRRIGDRVGLGMEINLSCPNIVGKPPPAYSFDALLEYILALCNAENEEDEPGLNIKIPVGIKTPPYSNPADFVNIQRALLAATAQAKNQECPISFITAVNTLGCSLVLGDSDVQSGTGMTTISPAINSRDGSGIGGLAGAPLHPIALGNVKLLRRMLDERPELENVVVIGIGGVSDSAGFARMKSVGAYAVGVGTALGIKGVDVFAHILGKS